MWASLACPCQCSGASAKIRHYLPIFAILRHKMTSLALTPSDLRILRSIQTDGRIANVALAERVGLSPSPCLRRTKQLEASGVIREAVLSHSEIVGCYVMTGEMDYLLHVLVRDLEAYGQFTMAVLLKMPGVKDVKSSLALEVVKDSTSLPLDQMDDRATPAGK